MRYVSDWQLVLGVVLLAIVLFRPDGLLGSVRPGRLRVRFTRRRWGAR